MSKRNLAIVWSFIAVLNTVCSVLNFVAGHVALGCVFGVIVVLNLLNVYYQARS